MLTTIQCHYNDLTDLQRYNLLIESAYTNAICKFRVGTGKSFIEVTSKEPAMNVVVLLNEYKIDFSREIVSEDSTYQEKFEKGRRHFSSSINNELMKTICDSIKIKDSQKV